ncbi:MAG TPA: hypothetical protein DEB06_06685 [Phycisphaerales bacterium]|nr:hypothetical protein [Phycisphaerales bacterium]
MSFASGLCVRPVRALGSRGAFLSLALATMAVAGAAARATTLDVNSVGTSRTNGTALPGNIPATATAAALPAGDRVIMTGGLTSITRQTWTGASLTGIRFNFSGDILDGVKDGDDVRFIYDMTVTASSGVISWIVRGSAAAPPAQGFTITQNGTAFAGGERITGEFGRTFTNTSTMTGDYSMQLDINWLSTSDPNATLQIVIHEAQVHLPSPGALPLLALATLATARRRRSGG